MRKILLFSLLILCFYGCREDLEQITVLEESTQPPIIRIRGSVFGFVVDESDLPISGATIDIAGQTMTTDEKGFFIFDNIDLDGAGSLLKAEKWGYFPGFDRFYPEPTATNFTKIKLISYGSSSIGASEFTAEHTIFETPNGARVVIRKNNVVDEAGNIYDEFILTVRWLDPRRKDLGEIMPGSLEGINSNAESVALGTYGMMAIDLFSNNLEELKLKDGAQAEIYFPIPDELKNTAPNEVPLWHFDEEKGLWIEEGKAILQDGFYLGTVSHFSFWNCDVPFPLANIQGRLVDENGNPQSLLSVCIKLEDSLTVKCGYTNDEGIFKGKVPKDEVLILSVQGDCEDIIITANLGVCNEDTDLGDIIIQRPLSQGVYAKGRLLNCNGDPLTSGVFALSSPNKTVFYQTNDDGRFFGLHEVCDISTIHVIGYDTITNLISSSNTFNNRNSIDVGDLIVCTPLPDEYIRLEIEGREILFQDIKHDSLFNINTEDDPIFRNDYYMMQSETTLNDTIYKVILGPKEFRNGVIENSNMTFALSVYHEAIEDENQVIAYSCFFLNGCNDASLEIKDYGGVFEPFTGELEGTFLTLEGPTLQQREERTSITGDFQVIRRF